MVYDFNFKPDFRRVAPIIQGLLSQELQEDKPAQPLSLLTEKPVISEQPPPEPPEQRGGTAMVNAAMENIIPQAPNPYTLGIRSDMVQAKNAYNTAKTDAERAAVQAQAALLQDIAKAANIDISGYGSDVSLEDAYKNLVSQQARDIMEGTQRYYAMNSDRYRDKIFDEAIARGLSPRRANKLADSQARRYQSDRVQYLDGLLNSYGRDGLIMNEYGNQILGMLAHEDPMLAGFYAGIYPNAKEAFARYNTLEDKAIDQRNQLEQLGISQKYGLDRIKAQTEGNIAVANNNFRNTLQRDEKQQEYTEREMYIQAKINEAYARLTNELETGKLSYLENLKVELKDKAFRQRVAQLEVLADYFGFEGDGKKSFVSSALGIKQADTKTGKFDDKSIENAKKVHDSLDKSAESILKQLKDGEFSLSEQEVSDLKTKLGDIRAVQQQIETKMGEQLGIEAPKSRQEIPSFTGNEEQDVQTLREMLRYMDEQNLSEDDINYYVRQWLPPDKTDLYGKSLIRKARGN